MWTMQQILFLKIDQRVAQFLWDEMVQKNSTTLSLTHDEIARYIGSAREVVTLFWTLKVPWGWAYSATGIPEWIVQFGFGFYSMMLTSTLIGLIVMVLYKPRTWCAFCPMGTMTQGICQLRAAGEKNEVK